MIPPVVQETSHAGEAPVGDVKVWDPSWTICERQIVVAVYITYSGALGNFAS